MSWLSSFLSPGKGYEAGQDELNKYYNQSQGYLTPFMNQGNDQYGTLNDIIKNLTDPTELNKKWTESYTTSPEALQAEKMAQESGLNAANAMGLMGSNTALNTIQTGTTQIGLNDRKNYLDDLMNKYMQGAGISQGLYNTGANAAGQLSNNATQMGNNSAGLAYGKTNAGGNMLSGLIGQGIGLVGSALSGPIGSALSKRWNLAGGA